MSKSTLTDFFARDDVAKSYSAVERVTGPPALALIQQAGLSVPVDRGIKFEVLDNACGTGVVSTLLYDAFKGRYDTLNLICGDFSPQMVAACKGRVEQMEGLKAEVRILDGQAIDIPADTFTHVLTNFGFQSFPQALLGLTEAVRVTQPGGTIGMTNWIEAGWVPAFRLAVSRIPGARAFTGTLPAMLKQGNLWHEEGWTQQKLESIPEIDPVTIKIEQHTFETILAGEEDIRAFMGPLEPMLKVFISDWSDEERAAAEGKLMDGIVQAMMEEPKLVWRSLVTTAHKRV
ncbi:hypothetical protein C8J56DRAFT_941834 [Mycena floridula]|nr:hypothetical protein C8J56DRAFT_941834 [Mycena floridula]